MNEFKINVKCTNNDDFNLERSVGYSCGHSFDVEKNDIYSAHSLGHFSESIIEFYAICPTCGRINRIDESGIPDDIKDEVDNYCKQELFLYQKNNLISKLIYLNMISPPIERNSKPLVKIRKQL